MVKIERGQLVFEQGDWTWNLEATMNNQYQKYNFIHGWTMNDECICCLINIMKLIGLFICNYGWIILSERL